MNLRQVWTGKSNFFTCSFTPFKYVSYLSFFGSHNATEVLKCIRDVTDSGCCLIMSIHHPNIQMFETIDNVILIHEGRCMLQCNVPDIPKLFQERGCPVPEGENPADWMLTVTQTHDVRDLKKMGFFHAYQHQHSSPTTEAMSIDSTIHESKEELQDNGIPSFSLPQSDACERVDNRNSNTVTSTIHALKLKDPNTLVTEVSMLLEREWNRTKRDRSENLYRIFLAVFGGSIFGIVFQDVARGPIDSIVDFNNHTGAFFFFFSYFVALWPRLRLPWNLLNVVPCLTASTEQVTIAC